MCELQSKRVSCKAAAHGRSTLSEDDTIMVCSELLAKYHTHQALLYWFQKEVGRIDFSTSSLLTGML
jgi:hypothetical protein